MRKSLGSLVAGLLIAGNAAFAGLPVPDPNADPPELISASDAERPLDDSPTAVPLPSIREPFSIGEALYDPSRVPDAVVSLLDLMGVPVVADQEAADRAPRLTLSEAETSTLIEMGVEDARAAAEGDEGAPPYTFTDLHAFAEPFLSDVAVETLAERYATAYESRPDDLAPKVMMGQPITPETPLGRVQIWLLLVDGFVGPGARAATAELGDGWRQGGTELAVYRTGVRSASPIPVAAPAGRWGTAQTQGQLSSLFNKLLNRADLPWIIAHLPLIQSRVPLTISPAKGVAHEGHGGNGPRLSFEASIGAAAPPVLAPSGRPVLTPLASPSVGGREIRWLVNEEDLETFEAHGTFQGAINTWQKTSGRGTLALAYTPKKESANGRGLKEWESARLGAEMNVWDLLSSRYDLAPEFESLKSYLNGIRTVVAPVRLEWHSDFELELTSTFDVALDLGVLGKTHRWGREGIRGSLARRSDGSFKGVVRARTLSDHVGGGLGKTCPQATSDGTQWLVVTATPVARLNANQDASKFVVMNGLMDGGYVKLTFRPASEPAFSARDACQDADELLRKEADDPFHFLPFNDARWHTPEHAWVIAIPKKEKLVYDDASLADVQPDPALGPFRAIIKGTFTKLRVRAERTGNP